MFTFKGHTGPVLSVAFSPDGNHLASGGQDSTLKIWDAQIPQETRTLRIHPNNYRLYVDNPYGVKSVAFSPDGKRLASCSQDDVVKVWDAERSQVTRRAMIWDGTPLGGDRR